MCSIDLLLHGQRPTPGGHVALLAERAAAALKNSLHDACQMAAICLYSEQTIENRLRGEEETNVRPALEFAATVYDIQSGRRGHCVARHDKGHPLEPAPSSTLPSSKIAGRSRRPVGNRRAQNEQERRVEGKLWDGHDGLELFGGTLL